ncbi:uncharacterized protein LOC124937526 [Impatiens glandulifera]|uniref:uncharacterized protein LOC124937526 n=1 Tax=Impatiens glandulifera TaxID=253017 RepID=UPI001FB14740|nr:uncharacterized protein LOC124937526 [Impatiens glandulifera]
MAICRKIEKSREEESRIRKARTYINEQKLKNSKKVEEIKQNVVVAKFKEKQLKQQMKYKLAQANNSKNNIPLSKHEVIVSKYKMQVAEAHDEMLQSKRCCARI